MASVSLENDDKEMTRIKHTRLQDEGKYISDLKTWYTKIVQTTVSTKTYAIGASF